MNQIYRSLPSHNLRWVLLSIVSFTLILLYILTAPVHVDEGWYYSVAKAKNTFGYYTFPPFYDVTVFQNELMILRDLMTQVYRFADLVFNDSVVAIKFLRICFVSLWVILFYLFLTSQIPDWNRQERLLVLSCLVTFPPIFRVFGIARADILISALAALLFLIFLWRLDNGYKFLLLLIVSIIMLLFHPNGVIFIFALGCTIAASKNLRQMLISCLIMVCAAISYYLIFIDPNFALYKTQFGAMYQGGNESKFLMSLSNLPNFIISEISQRYLQMEVVQKKIISLWSVSALLTGLVTVSGLIALFRQRNFYIMRVYIVIIMVFFILLGNKTTFYLIYILPFFLIATLSFFEILEKRRWIVEMAVASFCLIIGVSILANLKIQKESNSLVHAIKQHVPPGSVLYAPFDVYPCLGDQYVYLTTNQKTKAQMYRLYNISPSNCFVVAVTNDDIWQYCKGQRTDLIKIGQYTVSRIED